MAQGISTEELLQHAGWVRNVARSLTQCDASADDLEQEVWLAALRSPPRHREATGGWIRTTIRQLGFNRRRSEARRRTREQHSARPEAVEATATPVERMELQRALAEAILDLDTDQQTIIVMQFYDELNVSEIARRLDVPRSTIQDRSRAALSALRARLDHSYSEDRVRLERTLLAVSFSPASVITWTSRVARIAVAPITILLGVTMFTKLLIAIGVVSAIAIGFTALPRDPSNSEVADSAPVTDLQPTPDSAAPKSTPVDEETHRLRGHVRHRLTGDAIVAASVAVILDSTSETLSRTTTDSSGHYVLDVSRDIGRRGSVRVSSDGFVSEVRGLQFHTQSDSRLLEPFDLSPGVLVDGVVTDEAGRPVAGAQVELFANLNPYGNSGSTPRLLSNSVDRSPTDAQGRFRLHAPPENVFLIVTHPAFVPTTSDIYDAIHPATLPIELRRGASRVAHIRDTDGNAIVEADAFCMVPVLVRNSAGRDHEKTWRVDAESDGNGRIEWFGSESATELVVKCAGYSTKRVPAWKDLNEEPTIVLDRATSVRARVVDSRGRPVSTGVSLFWGTNPLESQLDAQGNLQVAIALDEPGDLVLFARGYRTVKLPVTPLETNDFATVELADEPPVEIRVEDASGRPLPGAVASILLGPLATPIDSRTTDDNGTVSLAPAWMQFELQVIAAGYATHRVTVDSPAEFKTSVVVLHRPASLTGRCVDRDGIAISGAKLHLEIGTSRSPHQLLRDKLRGNMLVSAADGRFRFPSVHPEAPVELQIEHGAFITKTLPSLRVDQTGARDIGDIVLDRARHLRGRVVDAAGRPVPEATVTAHPPLVRSLGTVSILTDDEGNFQLVYTDRGELTISVRAVGFATASNIEVPGGSEDRELGDLEIRQGTRLTGQIVDSNRNPVVGASVTVMLSSVGVPRVAVIGRSVTDVDGSYTVHGLPLDGEFRLSVRSAPLQSFPQWRGSFTTPLDVPNPIVLEEGATLIIDLAGAPEGFHRVDYRLRGASAMDTQLGIVRVAGHRGEAVGLKPGSFDLTVRADGTSSETLQVALAPGERVEVQPTWPGSRGEGAVIVVRDDRGEPVEGAQVRAFGANRQRERGTTDVRGEYTCALLSRMDGSITVEASGFAKSAMTRVPRSADVVAVVLKPESRVECTVTNHEGGFAPGVRVRVATSVDTVFHHRASIAQSNGPTTDENGRVTIEGLTEGTHWMVFERGREVMGVVESRVATGETALCHFQIPAAIEIHGRVTRGNTPLTQGVVTITAADRETSTSAVISPSGNYTATVRNRGDYRFAYVGPHQRLSTLSRSKGMIRSIAGAGRIDIALRDGATISGRVLDSDGVPVSAVSGRLRSARTSSQNSTYLFRTGTDGAFTIEGVERGDYHWAFSRLAENLAAPTTTLQVDGDDAVDVVLWSSIRLKLDVRTEDGVEPMLLMVQAIDADGNAHSVNLDRRTESYNWPTRFRNARIGCFGYVTQRRELSDLESDQTLEVHLVKAGVLKVYTLSAPETRAGNVSFEVEPLDGGALPEELRSATTGSTGFRRLELAPGRYRVTSGATTMDVEAVAGQEVSVRLQVSE